MKNILVVYCVLALFISGPNILDNLGWPTYGDGYRYPSPSFFFLIYMFVICLIKIKRIDIIRYELVGIMLIAVIMLFNKMTGRAVPLKEMFVGLYAPFMLSVVIKVFGDRNRSVLINLFVCFFVINSVIAIFEHVTHIYLFGVKSQFTSNSFGFRSHALLGHPLSNSAFTANVMFFLLITTFSIKKKLCLWILGFTALLCFNSRFSIVLSVLGIFVWAIKEFIYDQKHHKGNIIYLMIPVIVSVIVFLLIQAGYGQRLVNMGLIDEGSAGARIEIWNIFKYVDWKDLYFGMTQERQSLLLYLSGTDNLIIENCWIIFVLLYGYVFTISMFIYYTHMFRRFLNEYSLWHSCLVMIPWLLTISTSNSIAHGGGITSMLFFIYVFQPMKRKKLNRIEKQCYE